MQIQPHIGKVAAPPTGDYAYPSTTPRTTSVGAAPAVAAPKDSSVVDVLHGRRIADPFRPLENLDAPATVAWWKAQNARLKDYLSGTEAIRAQATRWHEEMRNYTRESMPIEMGGRSFFTRSVGLEPHPKWYVQDGTGSQPRVLIDPAALDSAGRATVESVSPSPDGSIVGYMVSMSGSDELSMRFKDVASGRDLYAPINGLRFTEPSWDPDGRSFLYAKPLPDNAHGKHFGVYRHTLGAPPAQDEFLFSKTDVPDSFVQPIRLRPDDPGVFFSVTSGTNQETGLWFQASPGAPIRTVLPPGVATLSPVHREGDDVWAVTHLGAPRNRLVRLNMNEPDPGKWQTIVPEAQDPGTRLTGAFVAAGRMYTSWTSGGVDSIEIRGLDGTVQGRMPIPEGSKVWPGQVKPDATSFELQVGGFLSPPNRFRYDATSNSLTLTRASQIPRSLTGIANVERIFATSKDGTKVPLWVIAPKNLKRDGTTPTILYGYGGFNSPMEPYYSHKIAHWVEQGGVYVVANLRGGGEFGRDWYDGGRLHNKQNVFDDFAAAAQALVDQGYTSPKKLAISGESNGGLLTAVTSQQRPELFGAVLSGVPVTDMVRFPLGSYGAAWKSDYGDPAVRADFEVAMRYSPLHNVRPATEVKYPPTLITTGDHDDRVLPWHAFKWAATRHDVGHADTTYLRTEADAGHGGGTTTAQLIAQSVDEYAFLVKALGITPKV